MSKIGILCLLFACAVPAAAQTTAPLAALVAARGAEQTVLPAAAPGAASDAEGVATPPGLVGAGLLILARDETPETPPGPPAVTVSFQPPPPVQAKERFDWTQAMREWAMFLGWQHSVRLFQQKTRAELGGPFWSDYVQSLGTMGGWGDGDSGATNYLLHPLMGAVSGYIQVQNDPAGRRVEFGRSRAYWHSRGLALAAAAIYSTQFELGPVSEASIGNVGLHPGTMAWVDMLVTPLAGFGMIIAEDAIDRYILAKGERGWSPKKVRIMRSLLNPNRSVANILRIQVPWKRDTRGFVSRESPGVAMSDPRGQGRAAVAR